MAAAAGSVLAVVAAPAIKTTAATAKAARGIAANVQQRVGMIVVSVVRIASLQRPWTASLAITELSRHREEPKATTQSRYLE
jgi:hypothetical protein